MAIPPVNTPVADAPEPLPPSRSPRIVGRRGLLAAAGILLVLIIACSAMTSRQIFRAYTGLQTSLLDQQIDRFLVQLRHIGELNVLLVKEYAEWDETYAYLGGEGPDYLQSYYDPGQNTTGEDVIMFFDLQHRLLATRWLRLEAGPARDQPLSEENLLEIVEGGLLSSTQVLGFVVEQDRVLLLAAGPVLHTDQSGAPRGWIVFGRWMDAGWLNETFDLIGMHVSSVRVHESLAAVSTPQPPRTLPASFGLIHPSLSVVPVTRSLYRADIFLPVLGSERLVGISVDIPLEIVETARRFRDHILLWGGAAALCLLLLLAVTFRLLRHTARIQAEERAREHANAEHIRRMAAVLPGIMYECHIQPDGTSRVVFVNEAVRDILGFEPHVLVEDPTYFSRFIHPDDRDAIMSATVEHIRELKPWRAQYRYVLPERGLRWVESQGHLTRRPDGVTVWNGFVTDITDRKAQEEALHESEARFRALMGNPSVGIAITAIDLSWLSANAAFARLLGYSEDDFARVRFRDIIPAGDLESLLRTKNELAAGRQPFYRGEQAFCRRDGTHVCTLLHLSVMRDQAGQPQYLVAQAIDLTDLKRIESELREAKVEADRANVAKSEFLATMSHEIRTPLHGVIGFTSLLQEAGLPPAQREIVDSIDQSSKILLALVTDVLDLSRIEAGRLALDIRDIDLRHHLENVARAAELEARRQGLAFRHEIDPSVPPHIHADSLRINQILGNLLNNAFKFTSAGSVTLAVAARPRPGTDTCALIFTVTDTGIGIPLDKQAILFEPFRQADSSLSRRYGGTGLGLTIVRRLCELMGGSASFTSTEHVGSTFTATIVVRAVDPSSAARPAAVAPADISRLGAELRVLVAEDNQLSQRLMQRLLERIGCASIDIVSDGQESVNAAAHTGYDLIFMDVSMPGMDGLQATRLIRDQERQTHRPRALIIALTAGVTEADRRHCLEAGMDHFLGKPFNAESLHRIIIQALGAQGGRA